MREIFGTKDPFFVNFARFRTTRSLTDLTTALGRLTVEERGGGVGRCVDILHYRAISSCHLHTILRTVWQAGDTDSDKSGPVFTMMNRLGRTQEKTYHDKAKTKIVRFRSRVTFKMSNIVCML